MDPLPEAAAYRLFIDESGDHVYPNIETNYPLSSRYLCLLGVWFEASAGSSFVTAMDQFKQKHFGDYGAKVTLHRKDILNCRGPFKILQENSIRESFDNGLMQLMQDGKFTVIAVTIDKVKHHLKYTRPYHPYHYCLHVILERYCRWLSENYAEGTVVAESRGPVENRELQKAYQAAYKRGTKYCSPELYQATLKSESIEFADKNDRVAGLELADALAHPVLQDMLFEKGILPSEPKPFARRINAVIKSKFHRSLYGTLDGVGKKWL